MKQAGRSKRAVGEDSQKSNSDRLRPYGLAIGLLFVIFVLSDYVFRPTFVSINVDSDETSRPTPAAVSALHMFVQFAIAIPIARIVMLEKIDLRRLYWFAIISGAVTLFATVSLLVHPDAKASINLLTVAWSLMISGILASSPYGRDRCMRDMQIPIAIGCGLILLWVAIASEYSWGRLAGRVGPNYWGMIGFITFVCSFSLPRIWYRLPIWAVIAYILAETSARGSLLALFVSACVFYAVKIRHTPAISRGWVVIPIIVVVLFLPLVAPYIISDVLLLDDARRGVGSGGTGRSIAWGQALDLIKARPWFGVGFRQHREYITIASSAHNAYLAALAEVGVFGFIAYLSLLFGAIYHAVRRSWRRPDLHLAAIAGFLIGFALIGLVESVWLTLGSPLPFLMVIFAGQAWSITKVERNANNVPYKAGVSAATARISLAAKLQSKHRKV